MRKYTIILFCCILIISIFSGCRNENDSEKMNQMNIILPYDIDYKSYGYYFLDVFNPNEDSITCSEEIFPSIDFNIPNFSLMKFYDETLDKTLIEWHLLNNLELIHPVQLMFCLESRRNLGYLFAIFSENPVLYLEAASITGIFGRIAVHLIAINLAYAKFVDPALFVEYSYLLRNIAEYQKISYMYNILLFGIEETIDSFITYFNYRGESEYHSWMDDVNWGKRGITVGGIVTSTIETIQFNFNTDGSDLSFVFLLKMILTDSSFNPLCLIVTIDESIQNDIISAIVNRILENKHNGFEIYRKYLEILTDSRYVFDVRTKEIFEQINILISQHTNTF